MKLFQNYFRGLLQPINIFEHVQCRRNNFEIISAAEIFWNDFSVLFYL